GKYEKQELAAKSMLGPNYPQYNRYFVGRREDLRLLRQSLVTSSCMALSAVNGLGGIGKTELSLTYGHAFAWDYGLGRVFIPCEKQTNFPEVLLSAGIDRMHGHELQKGTTAQRLVELVRLLEHKCKTIPNGRLFVILDNVDQPEFLHSLSTTHVPDCLHLIVTTRMPDEKLAGIRTQTVDKLSLSESLELLNNRRPIGTDPDERAAAEEIAKHFDGLTLAVDLAGAYLQARKRISYRQYWDELQKNPAEPPHLQDLPVRHPARCVSAVLTPTIRALSEPARWMLNLASLTAPDFVPIPWLEEFTKEQFRLGGLEDPLGELLDYHLITPTENENLGRIHRMTVFCLEKDADFTAGATAKLRARSESLLEQDVSFWTSGSQAWQLDAIQGIYELLLQNWTPETSEDAVDWALTWTFGTLGDNYTVLGMTSSAAAAFNVCFRIAEQQLQTMPESVLAQRNLSISYNKLGDLENALGNTAAARDLYEKGLQISLRLAEAMPDSVEVQRDLSISYERLGDLENSLGNTDTARDLYEKGLQIRLRLAEGIPDSVQAQRDLSISYERLGNLENALGNTAAARDLYEKGLQIRLRLAEAMPDSVQAQRDLSVSYNKLGDLENALGNTAAARDLYEKYLQISLCLAEAMPDSVEAQWDLSVSYNRMYIIAFQSGDLEEAEGWAEQFFAQAQRLAYEYPQIMQLHEDLKGAEENLKMLREKMAEGQKPRGGIFSIFRRFFGK
ncbi:MAG: hypothetical protein J6A23_01770, partial [Thermoguttaceae bacterium]|nr:hypothetical protein [Thermoguttaceae bacterium]